MNTNTEFRNNPGQEGIAIHSHRALLGRLAADGCKSRHGRYDRKRERSYSGLSPPKRRETRCKRYLAGGVWWCHVVWAASRSLAYCSSRGWVETGASARLGPRPVSAVWSSSSESSASALSFSCCGRVRYLQSSATGSSSSLWPIALL